jgi:2-dehydropantoate 2-reductase
MHFAILGSGAVGGYYGARLARAGQQVTFLARGAHLRAIRERGLMIWSPLGDFTVTARAEEDPAAVGPVDVVLYAVKTYDNQAALPMLRPLMGESTVVVTLQNGVESPNDVAGVVGERHVLGGAAYIATALSVPGLIEQTGTGRRIVFGEAFGDRSQISPRVTAIHDALARADIESKPAADAWVPIWEKFIYLSVFAAFTGAARRPAGPLWADEYIRRMWIEAVREVERVARAEGINVSPEIQERVIKLMNAVPPSTRSSLLIDLQQNKRIEVEQLQGTVVRRGAACGVPTPVMSTLYAVLKPFALGLDQNR